MTGFSCRASRSRYLAITCVSAALVIGGLAGPAAAAGPGAVADLAGCRTNTLAANDDSSTPAIPIGFTANFSGTPYTELFVNNNGSVTFDEPLSQYTPFDFSISGNVIVAPFLADVDTRGAGSTEVTYGQTTFDGQAAFCVDWVGVGYYKEHDDKLNSFQLLLVKRGSAGAFDIVFNYDQLQWESGDASEGVHGSGGTSAAWGYANGDGESAFVGPGSFANGSLLDSRPSSLTAGSRASSQIGRYVFPISETGPTGPKLSGVVTAGGTPVAFAPVQICPTGTGACITRSTNDAGQYRAFGLQGIYDLTAFPPAESSRTPGHAGPVTIDATDVSRDIALGASPSAPPDGTTITSIGTTDDGIPVAYWNDPLTLRTQACAGGTATYELSVDGQVERSGSMGENAAGTYTAVIAPLIPVSGNGAVRIAVDCPASPDEQVDFGLYIDPSGLVRDSLGTPVSGATVALMRAGAPTDASVPVPDGSAVMSPSNRTNPDATSADGRFGWDVVAGYYVVRASKPGCVSNADRSQAFVDSSMMTIPPPVTNLDLRLYCGESPPAPPAPPAPPEPAPVPVPRPTTSSRDTTAPALSGLALSPSRFKVVLTKQQGGTRTKNASRGSTIVFRLSEKATRVVHVRTEDVGPPGRWRLQGADQQEQDAQAVHQVGSQRHVERRQRGGGQAAGQVHRPDQ